MKPTNDWIRREARRLTEAATATNKEEVRPTYPSVELFEGFFKLQACEPLPKDEDRNPELVVVPGQLESWLGDILEEQSEATLEPSTGDCNSQQPKRRKWLTYDRPVRKSERTGTSRKRSLQVDVGSLRGVACKQGRTETVQSPPLRLFSS